MIFRQLGDGPCKSYLLASSKTHEAVLVDPLLEKTADYLSLLGREGLRLTHVIDTHTHADHLSGGFDLGDRAGASYVMHADTRSSRVTRRVQDAETLGVGDIRIKFLHTPGHTSDSISLLAGNRLLSGDFIFIGSDGAGRLDLPGGDPGAHFDSLKKLDALADDVVVMPAHDYQGKGESTLGAERRTNPVLSPRSREAYIQWWAERKFGAAGWMKNVVKANLAGALDAGAVVIPRNVPACCAAGPAGDAAEHPRLAVEDLACMIERKRPLVLLDVRTREEYADELGHIDRSILIPVDELSARVQEVPSGEIVAICRSGKRAARATSILRAAGRPNVWVLTGGMLAWNERRLPIK